MKKTGFVLCIFLSLTGYSQGFLSSKNIQVDLSGFVRNDFIFDARRNLGAADDLFELYPLKPDYDENGKDLNAVSSAKFLNTFSRFGARFSGLEMGKAKISGFIEFDFTGGSQTPNLRLRHANTQIEWSKSKLLIGRAWHPLFIEKVYPATLNENTGLPFQVFNRSPQVRFTHTLTKNMDLILAAVYQFDYSNRGPQGKSYQYQRDALIPDVSGQLQFYNENWVLGAAIGWKSIQPRTSTSGTNGTFKTSEKLNTLSALAYLKYSKGKVTLMAKSMFGQNVSESLLPGGYAVASRDEATGAETYTPQNHVYNWVNLVYGEAWKFGLYAGYLKNLGTTDTPAGPFYGMGTDIDRIYKISPQLIYTYKNFMFGWEISMTTAAYGDIDYSGKGKIINTEDVTNLRNMVSIAYLF